ncbi:MAG TPA: YihY/virulence factor BrkB family protein [Chloroflexia bacterium]|nr:YihY/virulence factor BrkB family protein [Chloroflexia bacterium]
MTGREFVAVVRATIREYRRNDIGNMAAALTYYSFFSLFPLLIVSITVAAIILGSQGEAADLVLSNLSRLLPGSRDLISEAINAAFRNRETAGLLAVASVLLLLFSASNAFIALDKAVNRAWDTEKVPSFLIARLISFAMILAAAGIMLVSFAVTLTLATSRALTTQIFGEVPGIDVFWQIANLAASVGLMSLMFLLIYRWLPRTHVLVADVWRAALLAAVIWTAVKEGFAYYLGSNFATLDAVYGTLSAVVVLLIWMYISSIIILAGAEFSAETAHVRRLRETTGASLEDHGPRPGGRGSPWLPGSEP